MIMDMEKWELELLKQESELRKKECAAIVERIMDQVDEFQEFNNSDIAETIKDIIPKMQRFLKAVENMEINNRIFLQNGMEEII